MQRVIMADQAKSHLPFGIPLIAASISEIVIIALSRILAGIHIILVSDTTLTLTLSTLPNTLPQN